MRKAMVKGFVLAVGLMASCLFPVQGQTKVKLRTPSASIGSVTKTSVKITMKKGIYTSVVKKKGKKVYDKISGYQIYRKKGKGTYKKVAIVKVKKDKIVKSKKVTGLSSGVFFGFRVRTFRKVGSKTHYSKWFYMGVTTKKERIKHDDSDSNPVPSKGDETDKSKGNSGDTGTDGNDMMGSNDERQNGINCIAMNTKYAGYTVEQMDALFNADYEQRTLERINAIRTSIGQKPLVLDVTLCRLAHVRARENVAMQTWIYDNKAHYRDDSLTRYWNTVFDDYNITNITAYSECIGFGSIAKSEQGNVYFYQFGNYGTWDELDKLVWNNSLDYQVVYSNSWQSALSGAMESISHRKPLIANNAYVDCIGIAFEWNKEKTHSVWSYVYGKYK